MTQKIYVSRRLQIEANPADSGCVEYHARFDVDNDGYYDLVSADIDGPNLKVWLGSSTGYSAGNSLTYPISNGGNCDISDLNLDNYPELIHSGYQMGNLCIYWGTATGPSPTDTTQLPNDGAEAVYVTDFDKDTYLDIITTSAFGGNATYIYWGSASGYSDTNKLNLNPGQCHGGSAVVDFNQDGLLDKLYYRGHLMTARPIIYWNLGISPWFSDADTHEIGRALNASGGTVADFNQDGSLDVFVNNFIASSYSYVFYGPTFTLYDSLPTSSDHHGTFREPRQVPSCYSRVVAPCTLGIDTLITGGNASWIANTPGSSRVDMYIRTGNNSVYDTSFTDWYQVTNGGIFPTEVYYRKYIQYRATLFWENPAELPNLEQVQIDCDCGPAKVEEATKEELSFDVRVKGRRLIFNYQDSPRQMEHPAMAVIEIYDITGRIVQSFFLKTGTTEIQVPKAGIYLLKDIKTNKNKKIIIF